MKMKNLVVLAAMMLGQAPIYAQNYNKKCSLTNSSSPKCYHPRSEKIINVALLYYGDHMTLTDLDRIEMLFKERFSKATQGELQVRILAKKVIGFKQKMPSNYSFNNITDPERLQRIYYSEKVGGRVLGEIYEEYKKVETTETLKKLDAILAITGAQFEGLGLANGRVSAVEHPQEIAWALPDGGRVKYLSDYSIVDELIHEIGHNMFLGHTSTQCQKPNLTLQEKLECCEQSPSKNDVLSYCRHRDEVDENFMHGFESCNMYKIKNLVIPSMLKGGKWNVDNSLRCK